MGDRMKGIKGRLLKKFRSIPSIYITSKQLIVPLYTKSSDETPQNPPNQMQQDLTTTLFNGIHLKEEKKNEHILSAYLSDEPDEDDIFEDCDSEFDSVPDMDSSSSGSSPSSNHSDKCSNLSEFDLRCPPGGSDKVILYTTSLRGIRKTYEECHKIKFLLESFQVEYFERDVSMHLGFRDELWEILGGRVIPPRLFIRGRHIGGADEVITLNEHGVLKKLLQGMPVVGSTSLSCGLCMGVRFVVCADCSGSCKVYEDDEGDCGGCFVKCDECNENGLVKCPTCSQ